MYRSRSSSEMSFYEFSLRAPFIFGTSTTSIGGSTRTRVVDGLRFVRRSKSATSRRSAEGAGADGVEFAQALPCGRWTDSRVVGEHLGLASGDDLGAGHLGGTPVKAQVQHHGLVLSGAPSPGPAAGHRAPARQPPRDAGRRPVGGRPRP